MQLGTIDLCVGRTPRGAPRAAILYGPSAKEWDVEYPWARGRREIIFRRVGEYIRDEKARQRALEYDFENSRINIISADRPADVGRREALGKT